MAAVVGALEMKCERIPATRTVSSLQQLCSRYTVVRTTVIVNCLASVSRADEQVYDY